MADIINFSDLQRRKALSDAAELLAEIRMMTDEELLVALLVCGDPSDEHNACNGRFFLQEIRRRDEKREEKKAREALALWEAGTTPDDLGYSIGVYKPDSP